MGEQDKPKPLDEMTPDELWFKTHELVSGLHQKISGIIMDSWLKSMPKEEEE